jgi:hypothetical protein
MLLPLKQQAFNGRSGRTTAVPPPPTLASRGPPQLARDALGDPGFQRFDVAGKSAAAHQLTPKT